MFYSTSQSRVLDPVVSLSFICFCMLSLAVGIQANPSFDEAIIEERVDSLKNEAVQPRFTPAVLSYVRTYVLRNRAHAEQILGRTVLYFPLFEKMLREAGLPEDLKYLPIVESALDPKAISRVGAKGLWQFMPETGKYYGLSIDKYIDDRCNPEKATQAAIRYLEDAYARFGSWELAIAAYNSGGGRVSRAIRRGRSKDFWKIQRYLPRETRNYVPAFIGAQYLIEHYKDHDLQPAYPPLDLQLITEVDVKHAVSFLELAQVTGIPMDWVEWLNPAYQLGYIPAHDNGTPLFIPERMADKVERYLEQKGDKVSWTNEHLGLPVKLQPAPKKNIDNGGYLKEVIPIGQTTTLAELAGRFKTNVHLLKSWNPEKADTLFEGQTLVLFHPDKWAGVGIWQFGRPVNKIPMPPLKKVDHYQAQTVPDIAPGCIWFSSTTKTTLSQIQKRFPDLSSEAFQKRNELPDNQKKIPAKQVLCVCPEDLALR